MKRGWIKLYRKSHDHWLYNENREHTKREAWEDILLLVNHKPVKVLSGIKLIDCNKGQSVRSLDEWGRIFNWDKSKVCRFFNLLIDNKMITTENMITTTRLTVCNYDKYQGVRNEFGTKKKRKRNGDDKVSKPNNNNEKVDNEINDDNDNSLLTKTDQNDKYFRDI